MIRRALMFFVCACAAGACDSPTDPSTGTRVSFFVTSQASVTGNLGGIRGADATCQRLATAAGHGNRSWRAYLSVERDPDNGNRPTDARSRIGSGPWFNSLLAPVARDLAELHARRGDAAVFLDENGQRINGQWANSPRPIEHDILTGSTAEGTLMAGFTCGDWTSDSANAVGQVGHSDGLGPNADPS